MTHPLWRSVLFVILCAAVHAAPTPEEEWLDRFGYQPPPVEASGVCVGEIGRLPSFEAVAPSPGRRMIRVSLPFSPGALPEGMGLRAESGGAVIDADVRILTLHPGSPPSARRAMVTFPFEFKDAGTQKFALKLAGRAPLVPPSIEQAGEAWRLRLGAVELRLASDEIDWNDGAGRRWRAKLIAPATTSSIAPRLETIESGGHFIWVRLLEPDAVWPRIIDVRVDEFGGVRLDAAIQRLEKGDATAPDLGWGIEGPPFAVETSATFTDGKRHDLPTADGKAVLEFPVAHLERRGGVEAHPSGDVSVTQFLRCSGSENVPFQEAAWRRASIVLRPSEESPAGPLGLSELEIRIDPREFDAAYALRPAAELGSWPALAALRAFHHDALRRAMRLGDDFGNVTSFGEGSEQGNPYGMNRLNHDPAIFEEAWRTGDRRLAETAALWCANMHDLSVWWGPGKGTGGTRYNNASAAGIKDHAGDQNFMWRTNNDSNFCTKGYDSFLSAYEETGDPRMLAALRAQVASARERVHCDQGECRNIGDVSDFMRLYRLTGVPDFRDEALRLFRELRSKLSPGDLFSQGGQPIMPDDLYIDGDDKGYKHPFAKPYILGYALSGLPRLMASAPAEPKLRDVIRAVADFQAAAQDPAGGWRYPHPRSSYLMIDQGIEHAGQLCRAVAALESLGEPTDLILDAVERALQARVMGFKSTGTILSGLGGWESAAGVVKPGQTTDDLYKRPEERDPSRDYTEGAVGQGGASPDGLAYFGEVLDFYLAHRPAERLFNANAKLSAVLARAKMVHPERVPPAPATSAPAPFGVAKDLPTFAEARIARMKFPLAWPVEGLDFAAWRAKARERLLTAFGEPPPRVAFAPEILAVEDRGGYDARKIALSLSGDARVAAYLLVPKGAGPFPAILALHDHGAHFTIGKEKVVRPFGVAPEKMADAEKWVAASYGGRFVGDELAKRGYVVLAIDALYWGDRGRAEGPSYEAQQAFGSNLMQLGMTWAGAIAWDDIRSAEFIRGLPEVDPARVGCVGLSMGASRAWHLAAATDDVKAAAAICWLGDTPTLMSPGNNQTRGQSAYSMLHPWLRNELDYPDVAAIACPKAALFFNGEKDALFPVAGVEAAYAKMRCVWASQGAGERLTTKLWPVPHEFNAAMQDEAFAWLDHQLKP